jgi:hypothetical protein
MAIYHYVLQYGSASRYVATEDALQTGSVLRLIRPADDRSATDDYRINFDDLVPMIVRDTSIEYHELPSGGFRRVTILKLVPPKPPPEAAPNPDA